MAGSESFTKRPNTLPQTNSRLLGLFACNREADHTLPGGCAVAKLLPRRVDGICGSGPKLALGEESTPRRGAKADFGKESVRPKGGAARGAAR
jgi:hypothetical protein